MCYNQPVYDQLSKQLVKGREIDPLVYHALIREIYVELTQNVSHPLYLQNKN